MADDLYTLGEVEWRFLPGRIFDMKTSKVRCRGYSVVQDEEVGFVFMRTGEWFNDDQLFRLILAIENHAGGGFENTPASVL